MNSLIEQASQKLNVDERCAISHEINNPLAIAIAITSELEGSSQKIEFLEALSRIQHAVIVLTTKCWFRKYGDEGCSCAECRQCKGE